MKNAGFLLCSLVFLTSANAFLKVSAEAREPCLGVQLVIPPIDWAGTGLILSGIVLFSL